MLLRSGGTVFSARFLQAALNACTGWLVARTLGPAGQGYYSLSLLVIVFLASLANGGVGLAAVPPLRKEPRMVAAAFRSQTLWVGSVALALVGLWFVGTWLGWDAVASRHLTWGGRDALAVWLAVPALILFDVLVFDHTAMGRITLGPLVNTGRAALLLLLVGVLTLGGRLSLTGVLAAYATAQLAAALVVSVRLVREIGEEAPRRHPSLQLGALLKAGWVGQFSTVVSTLHMRLDLALVAAWHGAEIVGIYSVAVLVGELLWMLPGALQPVLVYTAGDPRPGPQRDRTTARAVRLGLLATLLAALVLAAVAPAIFGWLFGGRFDGSVPALWALLPGIVIFSIGAVLAGDFIGRGRPHWNTQASLWTLATNIGTGVLLIPSHGAVGAAWASSLAYAVGSCVMLWRFRNVSGLGWAAILVLRRKDFRLR